MYKTETIQADIYWLSKHNFPDKTNIWSQQFVYNLFAHL